MTTELLAYIPSPSQGVWHLGPFPLRAYALCIIVGIVVAIWWGNRRWIARGGRDGEVLDVAIWAVPFGLIGGRIYHVITDWNTYFGDGAKEPVDAFKIWDGGLGIWGAVAFGALGAWIGARRAGIKLPPFGDAIAPPILLAQAIGRLGNWFNQELYGDRTDLPWGLKIYERSDSSGFTSPNLIDGKSTGEVYAIVQPTFLYELLWNLLIVAALIIIDRRFRIGHGRLFALYVAGYCVGRFVIETLRTDPATMLWDIRINLFTSALVFVCAALYVVIAPKGRETPHDIYHPGAAPEAGPTEHPVDGYVEDEREPATVAAAGTAKNSDDDSTHTRRVDLDKPADSAGPVAGLESKAPPAAAAEATTDKTPEVTAPDATGVAQPAAAADSETVDKPATAEATAATTTETTEQETSATDKSEPETELLPPPPDDLPPDPDIETPGDPKLDKAAKPYRKPKPDTATGADESSN
ncbi:prolipoprotein diacylglyceryl transferase [Microbispora sp. NRRL B-24597]|uniref:prolipoprotein diacylglyceryl transferase n=1 Tax=Microbispora sp. NRRL B-24597 TaxID=1463823 RepID=UPI0009DCCD76|nr:prolipoprotein diacylglyceryl transferase [Microbispora sp. NRRL B-24597]